jgi:hypothetical protein
MFGLSKEKEVVNGLEQNEIMMTHRESDKKIQGKKVIWAVTNKRLLCVNKGSKSILNSYDLATIVVIVKNKKNFIKYANTGVSIKGDVDFLQNGQPIGSIHKTDEPDEFANVIEQCKISLSPPNNPESRPLKGGMISTASSPETDAIQIKVEQPSEDLLKILKMRFVNGEISKEEFKEMKEMLK